MVILLQYLKKNNLYCAFYYFFWQMNYTQITSREGVTITVNNYTVKHKIYISLKEVYRYKYIHKHVYMFCFLFHTGLYLFGFL